MGAPRPRLTVIVPVFNEERTVGILLRRLLTGPYPYPEKELIVVDDGSTDATATVLREFGGTAGIIHLHHEHNRGKSSAIRTALPHARGEVTIIQDADLEYDSQEIPRLVEVIHRGEAEVVYGSRYLAPAASLPWTRFRLAVVLLNGLVRLLYGQRVTDEATCYKAFRTSLLRDMNLQAERFEFCPEVTAKACRMGCQILEVPISYQPRSAAEGKKIRVGDGFEAAWTLLRWRFQRFPHARARARIHRGSSSFDALMTSGNRSANCIP